MNDRMDRREAIKWMLTAAATAPLLHPQGLAAERTVTGYGTDPQLMKVYRPGEVWPLTLTEDQRATVSALCDVIIPKDDKSPSASEVGVPDFIDEWISAPDRGHDEDRKTILAGLEWLNSEAEKRFQRVFAELPQTGQQAIGDEICYVPNAQPEFKTAAEFFARFRNLTASGFYTSPEGMKDVQYVGNLPLASFDGPPPEVLRHLKLA